MQRHIDTPTQLDLVRADAAARQRRAATYRFVHAERPARRGSLTATVIGAALALGVVTGAAAQVIDSQPVQQGYEAGLPDGWYDPAAPTVTAAADDDTITPASVPVRQGYLPGHADGWFNPDAEQVRVAGIVLDRTTNRVPRNVR